MDSVDIFIGGIQHCVKVVGNCIFDSNMIFALPLNRDDLEYCCTNDGETKVMNGHKRVLKPIWVFKQRKTSLFLRSKNS